MKKYLVLVGVSALTANATVVEQEFSSSETEFHGIWDFTRTVAGTEVVSVPLGDWSVPTLAFGLDGYGLHVAQISAIHSLGGGAQWFGRFCLGVDSGTIVLPHGDGWRDSYSFSYAPLTGSTWRFTFDGLHQPAASTPEPAAYGLLTGLGLVVFGVIHSRKDKQ